MRDVCADHSDPPTLLEKKEAHEVRMKCPQLDWYNSDSSRWTSVCPMTGFMKVKSVLDSGVTDSCAPDCMCPEVMSRRSEGSRRGQMYTAAGG